MLRKIIWNTLHNKIISIVKISFYYDHQIIHLFHKRDPFSLIISDKLSS